ncbi:MAG: ribosome biogenesis GTPase Der [Oligoflexia bacterium]|nr:ribosome biogenesis GTPase Der [Oligoflexia bacterium]
MKRARIVIVGRPNVGKSTLFNRLTGTRRALVHDEPGVTRDRLELKTEWWAQGRKFPVLLTDTGGVGGERFGEEIDNQVGIALEDADAVIVVFDGRAGLTALDEDLMKRLNRAGVLKRLPVVAAVNKIDAEQHEAMIADFYSMGLENVLTISAEHGRGIDDLEETIAQLIPDFLEEEADSDEVESEDGEPEPEPEEGLPRIAIVGRPNVGKSTLTNALLNERRMITSPIAGTTVDAVDSLASIGGKPFVIIDTAGIRRKSKTEQGIEVLSVVQARKTLERADVALLILDGEKGLTDQDEKIGGLIEDAGCGVVLVLNKWDTQRGTDFTQEQAAERIRGQMAYLKYAPIVFTSAKFGKGLNNIGELLTEILHQRKLKIPTHEFTEWVRKESTVHNPMNAKFYMCHQAGRHPPTFVCHVNDPERVDFSLKRHLLNALRERWGFMGSPVRLLFVKGASDRKPKH